MEYDGIQSGEEGGGGAMGEVFSSGFPHLQSWALVAAMSTFGGVLEVTSSARESSVGSPYELAAINTRATVIVPPPCEGTGDVRGAFFSFSFSGRRHQCVTRSYNSKRQRTLVHIYTNTHARGGGGGRGQALPWDHSQLPPMRASASTFPSARFTEAAENPPATSAPWEGEL